MNMQSTPSLYLSRLSHFVLATTIFLTGAFSVEGQSCGTFSMLQNPSNRYEYAGAHPIDETFNAEFSLTDVKIGQRIAWQWKKNGVLIGTEQAYVAAAPGSFSQPSSYNISSPTTTVDHSGDYHLQVSSSCPTGGACTCTATFNSNVAIMKVDPTISVNPVPAAVQIGNNANFNVTATDGLGGVALVYEWYRREPQQSPYEVLVGTTSGALTSNQVVLLDQLSKTGNYFVRVTHNRGGSNPDRSVYGEAESYNARLAMNIPNTAAMNSTVCLTPSWQLNQLEISPENFVGGFYQVNQGGSFQFYMGYSSSRYNGLGSCSSTSEPANSYVCTDYSRPLQVQEYTIQVPTASVIQTAYRYEKNAALIPGTADTTIDPSFDSYYDNLAQPADNGTYRLALTSVPCGTIPSASNAFPVQVISAPITINSQYSYVYDNLGNQSNQLILPTNPNTVVRGGAYLYVSASHATESLNYQWQKYNTGTMSWVAVPADSSGLIYYGQNTNNLVFRDDADGDDYDGIRYSDAGQYRLRIQTASLSATVYSSTFTLGVYPQSPLTIQIPDTLVSSAGASLQLYSFTFPPEATNLNYNWEIRNVGSTTWTPLSTAASPIITTVQGNYQIRTSVSNTTVNATSGQPETSPTRISNILTLTVNPPPLIPPSILTPPASISVVDGQAAIFQVSATGSIPLSYQWQESLNMGAFQNVGTNSPVYSFLAIYNPSITSRRYQVVVSNPAGNITSPIANLTVTAIAPTIISHPVDQAVPEGAVANFIVSATGTAPLAYQWQESLNMAAFTNIAGATSTLLQITAVANPAITSRRYRAVVSNTGGSATSNIATLTIQAATCSAPDAPVAVSPANGSQNISLLPTLSWQPVGANPNCTVTYDVRVSLTGANNCQNPVSAGSTLGTIYAVAAFLQPQTNYFWCVRAAANGVTGPWNSASSFMTTTSEVPAPTNLYTLPYTTPSFPAGNQNIILGAMNGEPTATGIFYLKQASGDIIVGSTVIGTLPGGRFEISVDITDFGAASGPREFYARQQRSGQTQPGAPSESVFYYYDAGLNQGLMAPALQKNDPNTVGSLKWNPVEGAASYKVYRRVNTLTTALPAAQPLYAGTDGLGPKPFTLLPNVTPVLVNGFMTWTDNNFQTDLTNAGITLSANGVSYFVTAVSDQSVESTRSNSQSFSDTVGPVRSQLREGGEPSAPYEQQVFYLGTQSGRSARGYLCNVNPGGYFHGSDFRETSADIIALVQVKVKPVGTSCAALSYDQGSQSYSVPFDSIETVDTGGFTDCLSIGEVGNETLIPNTDYCFKSCLRDTSNNSETNCLEATFGETLPDGEAPDFAGVDSVSPREDGTSFDVSWNPPTYQQQVLEPITYIVTATNKFAEGGEPIFDGTEVTREVPSTETSVVLDSLITGRTYCVRVAARDDAQNEAGNNATKCGATLNNIPFVDNLSISNDEREAQKINIEFSLVDRQQDGVLLSKLAFKTAENSNWIQVSGASLSGNSDFLVSADSIEAAPKHKVVFDSLPYFIGQRENFSLQLTFVDAQGNEAVVETEPTTAFYSNSRNASYSRTTGLGCTSSAAGAQGDVFMLVICLVGIIGALGLKTSRYRAFTGITK